MAIIDSDKNLMDYLKQVTIKDAMYLFATAWSEVSASCIAACWRKGLGDAVGEQADSDSDFDEADIREAEQRVEDYDGFNNHDMLNAKQALGPVTEEDIKTWLTVDDEEQTSAVLTDEQIIQTVTEPESTKEEEQEEEDEEPIPAMAKVVRCIQVGLRWVEKSAKSTPAEVMHFRNALYRASSEARSSLIQKELTDFFNFERQ
ncbi:hypothetical protein DPMN_051548 [Dreissena polymorpha]|uniref:DDE-1 domain-containing protein n=1 Tax=Dreissena polymorpha TaxID=45954 RepID=A0A9D4CJC3_DREPO|nr:hypothetical protein DPMN_051548 [Dreissena polymorpha]